ncbi:type I-E CRISPR-associated protein Cse1/CasA [Nocardiopsis sp. HNM0947]|uniref:Type I-E CRISPR-associated protein Cse1/CasA n=1 Tax=Nocardiopsis coralli TaxID=2772213 RepID=A0ABR9P473_9ACTN|nr:type I-E CRISPR-associated protein Cse1/CasA [Nocardiopsis coralli]MBE2998643.1 type I-E CRISPR-associated protein Cse1/CasA [Nocardiopsis coralli]
MTLCRFNLLDEQWIPVITTSGESTELGILDVFRRSGDLRCIRGESPVVTASLYRLLLAFLHRSLDGPKDEDAWGELWASRPGSQALKDLDKHGESHRDAFWLLGGERPFFQCPNPSGVRSPASQLLLHRATGNNTTLFDHTVDSDQAVLPADVAARWLVAVQFYDTGGLKPGRLSSVASHGNSFGTVLLEGSTLWETLMLNAVVYAPEWQLPIGLGGAHDCAVWERTSPPSPESVKDVRPKGWAHLLTLPTRNILLHWVEKDGAPHVDAVVVSPGEQLAKNLDSEMMAAFAERETKGKKKEVDPVKLEMLRGVWRHATDLLLPTENHDGARRPATVSAAADHVDYGRIDPGKTVTLRVFGQKLMSNPGAVEYWSEEAFPIKLSLLVAQDRGWSLDLAFGHSVKLADDVGKALQGMLRTYRGELRASFDRYEHWSFLAERYWPHLDTGFQRLLHDVGDLVGRRDPGDPQGLSELRELLDEWQNHVRTTVDQALDTWLERSPGGSPRQVFELASTEMIARSNVNKAFDNFDEAIDPDIARRTAP